MLPAVNGIGAKQALLSHNHRGPKIPHWIDRTGENENAFFGYFSNDFLTAASHTSFAKYPV
jgi:hypothetical protein